MSLAFNRRRFLNLVCLVLLFILKETSQFLVQFAPLSVSSRFIYFVIFCQKHVSQYVTELPFSNLLQSRRFKYGTLHTEVVYSHQASVFRAFGYNNITSS